MFWTYRSGHPVSVAPAVAPDDLLIAVDTHGNVNALRWCLTRFVEAAHMAEESSPPRTEEAIELWLLAQDVDAALQLAEKAQRWDVVARLATDLQLHGKAAEACEHLAAAHTGTEQAAASWQAAAAHWRLTNRSEREQACLLKAAELRQAPLLTLRIVDQPEFVRGLGTTVRVAVVNLTGRLAKHARLRCGGHVALQESEEFSVGGHQEHWIDVSVTPTRSGSASLELHLTYADSRGQLQAPVEMTARLAVAQPPVVENHFYGPAITGEGVIIVRRESGRTLQVRDTEDTLQLGPSTRIVCPYCQRSTVAEAFCNWCGGTLA